jgi:hypothetical protein
MNPTSGNYHLIGVTGRTSGRLVRVLACALAATIALLVAAAGATAHGPDPVYSGRWNQNQALGFAWRSGWVPPTGYQTAIRAAAADASATRGSQAATFAYSSGATNLVGYGTAATCGPQGLACFSRNAPTSFTMWMREQGHRFDWGSLRWCQAYATWPNGCYDVENIMLDEFGHVEILRHHDNYSGASDYTDAVVQEASRTKPNAGWNAHAFGRCDIASLQMQYDMQGWGAKYSSCLDLATTLALGASAGYVGYGGTVTLTATLKVADNPAYSRLAANPVALRYVTLERRPPGGSWSTIGTMSYGSTSGTYTRAVQLFARTEFRAVFAKPYGEGLRAATSPTVTVAIGP